MANKYLLHSFPTGINVVQRCLTCRPTYPPHFKNNCTGVPYSIVMIVQYLLIWSTFILFRRRPLYPIPYSSNFNCNLPFVPIIMLPFLSPGGAGEGWAPAAYLDQRKTSRSSSRSQERLDWWQHHYANLVCI